MSVNQTYQLWALTGTRPVSLGVLGANPQQTAFSLGSPNAVSGLAVSIEPAGGAATPSDVVASGPLGT